MKTSRVLDKADDVLRIIEKSSVMIELWQQYQKNNLYAASTSWEEAIEAAIALLA